MRDDLAEHLGRLAPVVDETAAWAAVMSEVPRWRRRRRTARAAAGTTMIAAVAVVAWFARPPEPPVFVTAPGPALTSSTATTLTTGMTSTTVTPTTSVPSTFAGEPSQSPEDAARDGVHPDVAALPYDVRVSPEMTVEGAEGSWIVSRLSDEVIESSVEFGCLWGESDGGQESDCSTEYGEILLVDDGAIVVAYPMRGAPVTWIHLAEEAVFAGRTGDGGLPASTLIRIDRAGLDAEIWVVPNGSDTRNFSSAWQVATGVRVDRYHQLVGFGGDGTSVDSTVGDIRVDLAGLRQFFSGDPAMVDPTGLVRVDRVERCGSKCFQVDLAPARPDGGLVADPADAEFNEPQPVTITCGAVEGAFAYAAWDFANAILPVSGCQGLLAVRDWAVASPYFWMVESADFVELTHAGGSWLDDLAPAYCWGVEADAPACRANEGTEARSRFARIESLAVDGLDVTASIVELDLNWDGETYSGTAGTQGTLAFRCDLMIDLETDPGVYRRTDGCGLGEMFPEGADARVFEFLIAESGEVLSGAEVTSFVDR